MMKYPCRKTVRFTKQTQSDLDRFCHHHRINESEYIRISLQKCLYADMRNNQKTTQRRWFGCDVNLRNIDRFLNRQ